ncbi:hypothetical protein JG688_00007571 [Phytophthora aleatoria]|uniref:Uncharacterized protein n=1 Tax=Phytophthora aleatoria TaxID=2496075 RepID=A0A8J5M7Z2_9STRA|nr:hypothetical protein JG688_00007571 [Phytophthora aleatoria]
MRTVLLRTGTQSKEREPLSACQTGIEVLQVEKSRLEPIAKKLLMRIVEKDAKLTQLLNASERWDHRGILRRTVAARATSSRWIMHVRLFLAVKYFVL